MKTKKYMVIGIIVLLISLVGSIGTYAWFTWSSTNNTSITISIGELADVIFSSGNDISTNKLAPVFNYTDGESTSFTITNKSDTSFKYKILLNIISIDDELKNVSLKYKLVSNNVVVTEGNFNTINDNSNNVLFEGELFGNSITYVFYLYIDGNEENDLSIMDKSISGNINVLDNVTFSEYITNLYTFSLKQQIVNNNIKYNYAPDVNLMNDRLGSNNIGINDGNIRYYGIKPNNYIYFNCDDYSNQTSDTCEIWRIIGVFDGKIKIMRNESIGKYSYDTSIKPTYGVYGSNDWISSSLMKLLNNGYENNSYVDTDGNDVLVNNSLYWNASSGNCYNNNAAITSCDFEQIGLKNDITRSLIYFTKYYLGGTTSLDFYSDEIYNIERKNDSITEQMLSDYWDGQIALPYLSDYSYAMDFNICSNKLSITMNYNKCNWIYESIIDGLDYYVRLLTINSSDYQYTLAIRAAGTITLYGDSYRPYNIIPTLSLISDIKIIDGSGSIITPYKLMID